MRIGITPCGRDVTDEKMMNWVRSAGGEPELLGAEAELEGLSGLILSGGDDVEPTRYGEAARPGCGEIDRARDAREFLWLRAARDAGLPVLGICRGCQVLNVFQGGTLIQDIPSEAQGALTHRQGEPYHAPSHAVDPTEAGRRAALPDQAQCQVNSMHHQAVKRLGAGLAVLATAQDGIIEAFQTTGDWWALGVQWHPECMAPGDAVSARIFQAFVDACKERGKQTCVRTNG